MTIPLFNPTIRRKEMDSVLTCMVSDLIGPGELNRNLIEKIAIHAPNQGGVCLREPSRALEIALLAAVAQEKRQGAKVLLSALAPDYFYLVLIRLGFEPIICDVDPHTAVMALDEIKNKGPECDLAIVDYPLGNYPHAAALKALSIPIIEDLSCSIGTASLQEISEENLTASQESALEEKAFSPGQLGNYLLIGMEEGHLIPCGGGAVVLAATRGDYLKLKRTCDHFDKAIFLPDLNAALASVQALSLSARLEKRKEIAAIFKQNLKKGSHKTLAFNDSLKTFLYAFPVLIDLAMNDVIAYSKKKGVMTRLAFENVVLNWVDPEGKRYQNAFSLQLKCLLFPLYSLLGNKNVELIAKVLLTLP